MDEGEWKIALNPSLKVGVRQIDEEHRQFVARASELNKAILECEEKAKVKQLLDLMMMEAKHHFRHEQQLLAEWNYPHRAALAARQARFTEEWRRVMQAFDQADVSFTWAVKGLYLKQLLLDHLLRDDRKCHGFLRQRQDLNVRQEVARTRPSHPA